MYLAQLQTSNYQFLAVGHSQEHALELMRKAWERHVEGCENCYEWEFVKGDVDVRFTRSGDIWRDGTLIHSHDSSDPWKN